jgi:hypothetical protein
LSCAGKFLISVLASLWFSSALPVFAQDSENLYRDNEAWDLPRIRASHIIHNLEQDLPDRLLFEVEDPLNLFLVVELCPPG